jgi:protein-disulfide isomerase
MRHPASDVALSITLTGSSVTLPVVAAVGPEFRTVEGRDMPANVPKQTQAQRRAAAQAQALEIKRRDAARDKRSRMITLGVLGIVLVLLVGTVTFLLVQNKRNNPNLVTDASIAIADVANAPTVAGGTGGIPIDSAGAASTATVDGAPTVDIYFDAICPFCGDFETANGAAVTSLVTSGSMNLVLHPLNGLDHQTLGTRYSTRAGAALAWIAQNAPEYTLAFQQELYVDQPEEGSKGLSNAQLAQRAKDVGVPSDVANGIASGTSGTTYAQWVESATAAWQVDPATAGANGQHGTPTIIINGVVWSGDPYTTGPFEAAVRAAAAG